MKIEFTTNKVRLRKGEDSRINPGCYGLYLAKEIRDKLRLMGYKTFAGTEDWGWYIVIKDRPYFQWIGCGNLSEINESEILKSDSVRDWHVWIVNECGHAHRLLRRSKVKSETNKLYIDLLLIIKTLYGESVITTAHQGS